MKIKLLLITLLTLSAAATAMAADQYLYTGKGTVTFEHKAHADTIACSECHTTATPEKIAIENKQQGHDLCLTCHKAQAQQGNAAAPTKCNDCHKK